MNTAEQLPLTTFPEGADGIALLGKPSWTWASEVQAMIRIFQMLAPEASGILEIGCNEGEVTAELAHAFPSATVVGVDWSGPPTMVTHQRHEQPAPGRIGCRVQAYRNAVIIDSRSIDLSLERHCLGGVRRVFVDGDHSYDGVQMDTEMVLGWLTRTMDPWVILWHDANEDAPPWIGVHRYLTQLRRRYPVRMIRGTRLAVLASAFIEGGAT